MHAADGRRPVTLVRIAGIGAALTIGALHAWAGRHSVNIDGVSYLDLGDALARGDWLNGINAHWSPAYAFLLGLTMSVLQPSPYWEFAAAHWLNFAVFAGALAAFDLLLRAMMRHQRRASERRGDAPLPEWAWVGLGYLLFLWGSLQLIELWILTPDLALSAFVYLATAMVISLRAAPLAERGIGRYAAFGAVLACGYLVKSPMFVLAFVFLAVAWLALGAQMAATRKVAVALLVFCLLSAPFVTALSLTRGRVTFGESRTLAFAWFVNGVPFRHWQGGYPASSSPVHPTRKVLEAPATYEFATPIAGTYPAWFDPSYWYEGIRPQWNADQVLATISLNVRELVDMFVSFVQVALLAGVALMVLLGRGVRQTLTMAKTQWPLFALAATGLGMYAMVSVFPRYVAPFMVLLWLGILGSVRLPDVPRARRLMTVSAALLMLVLVALLAVEIGPTAAAGAQALRSGEEPHAHPHWRVASGLNELGLQPGERVAWVHPEPNAVSWSGMTGWARLARVRIVAEVQPETLEDYWHAPAAVREQVLDALSTTGATFAVTMKAPAGAVAAGWQPIGDTGYFARRLAPPSERVTSGHLERLDSTP